MDGTSSTKDSQVIWTKTLTGFPNLTHEILEEHFVLNSSVTDKQPKGATRHKKLGYQLFKSGYVNGIVVKPDIKMGDETCFLVRARVNAQMKKIEYMVYVHILTSSGKISYAKCQCPAGKGGVCKHVAAVLFQILEFKELELSEVPDDISCTEKLQKWNVPATGNEMKGAALFEDLLFEQGGFEKDRKGRKRPLVKGKREGYKAAPSFAVKVLKEDIKRLRNGLAENDINSPLIGVLDDNNCNPFDYELWHNNLPSKLRNESKRKVISGVNSENVRVAILNGLTETLDFNIISQTELAQLEVKKLTVDLKKSQEIERNTRDQADCQEWYSERKQRLTSSNFGSVMNRRESIYPKTIVEKVQKSSTTAIVSKSCKWGHENESNALLKYYEQKESENIPIQVCGSVGLVINPKWPWLGASPDALACSCQELSPYGAVEIKCPSSKIDMTISEACKDGKFYLHYLEGKPVLKRKHVYFFQLQGIMAICQLKWIDFVVYTVKDLHIERVYFDQANWESNMLPKLTRFYFQYLI